MLDTRATVADEHKGTGHRNRLFPGAADTQPGARSAPGWETFQAGVEDFLVKLRPYREQKCKSGNAEPELGLWDRIGHNLTGIVPPCSLRTVVYWKVNRSLLSLSGHEWAAAPYFVPDAVVPGNSSGVLVGPGDSYIMRSKVRRHRKAAGILSIFWLNG